MLDKASFRRIAGRSVQSVLKHVGLKLTPIDLDFEARLVSPKHVDQLFSNMAQTASEYLYSQKVIPIVNKFDVRAEIDRFFDAYMKTPFREQGGGSRFGNLLWLDLIAKSWRPDLIVDSGTYRGASAWALAEGAPESKILSFDIDLSRLELRSKSVEYFEQDWTTVNFDDYAHRSSLCYFDDHLDQGKRLKEAADRKFQVAIFDDDFSIFSFAPMAHGGHALPKISFILDESLLDGDVIEWVDGGKRFSWKVDRPHLDSLKRLIGAADRLPSLVAPLLIDQLPYRVVAIADASGAEARQAAVAEAQ